MRIVPTKTANGTWMNPIPFMITRNDLETLIKNPRERESVSTMLGARLDNLCSCRELAPVVGHYSDPESEERARVVNRWFNVFNGTVATLRNNYFEWVANKSMKAGEQLEYDFATKDWVVPDTEYIPEPSPTEKPRKENTEEFRLLISTRKLLGALGVEYYDGPEFKFMSNHHPSPTKSYLTTLAKEYMMKVIIPNALLSLKYRKTISLETALLALDYCMTTGKSGESTASWEELKKDTDKIRPIAEKYLFYVLGKTRDGRDIKADHRCYFEKYVSLKAKDTPKFRRGKNQEVVDGLLKRMAAEPELRTMSHRQLLDKGITNRAARMFMEARRMG